MKLKKEEAIIRLGLRLTNLQIRNQGQLIVATKVRGKIAGLRAPLVAVTSCS